MNHDDDRALIDAMAAEIGIKGPMHLAIAPLEAFRLVGMLQLASRHSGPGESNRQAVRWFIEHVRAHFSDCPALLEVIRRGDNPAEDR